jgi:hypothetical protein
MWITYKPVNEERKSPHTIKIRKANYAEAAF